MNPTRILAFALSLASAAPLSLVAHSRDSHSVDAVGIASLVNKADALMQRSRDGLDPSLYAPAEELYRRALAQDPECVAAKVGLAWVHNSEHEFAEGRRWAESALAIDPRNPDAHALIGDGAVELGDYDTAFEAYQKALDARPDLSSYSRASQLLWLTGDSVGAKELMIRAIAAGGPAAENTAWCRAQLATMFFHSGDMKAADRVISDGLRDAPGNPHLLLAAGRVRAARGDTASAIDALTRSVKIAPSHPALALLVDLNIETGDEDTVQSLFSDLIAFHAEHSGGHDHDANDHDHGPDHASAELALFLADHDRDIDRALEMAQAAHAAFPNVFAADALAWCQFKAGRIEEAAATIQEALRYGTPMADVHFHAGMIFARLGEATRAKESLARAIRLNPSFHPRYASEAANELARLQKMTDS